MIAFTSACSFGCGIAIDHYQTHAKETVAKIISLSNVIINLVILGIFKYFNFFIDSLQALLQFIDYHLDLPTINVILPVGISFYTFQALSYTIDVQRRKIEPTRDPFSFFAFISFFPQLVAGPIERATNLLPQFQKGRTFNYEVAVDGCRQMLWGFFKKVVIADNCAYYANIAFDNHTEVGSLSLLLGAFFFTFQIYGDFSGYSSIAIGCANLFGITLQPNFKVPYFSRDIAEFWKRWHISLNKWFVDYVYIPMGGSRVSKIKVVRNTLTIFLLSGLWHGANWTYIVWGLYHACLFIPLIVLNKNHRFRGDICRNRRFPSLKDLMNIFVTFILVMIGWVVFRATSFMQAVEYLSRMVSLKGNSEFGVSLRDSFGLICMIIVVLCIEWWNRKSTHEFQKVIPSKIIRTFIYLLLIGSIYASYMMGIEDDNTFIYFQF